MEELGADAVVQPHAFRDVSDIRAGDFAEFGEHVDEADLRCEERVTRILHDLRALAAHEDKRLTDARNRAVELFQ